MASSYIDALNYFWPGRVVQTTGDGHSYEALEALDGLPLPPKSELDEKRLRVGQERVWRQIQQERDRRKFGGVKVGNFWFHTDDSSRIQQIGLLMMGANLPPIQWKTMSGAFVTMTPTLASQIFQGTAQQDIQLFMVAETHRQAMMQLEHPTTYDFSSGWPATFVSTEPNIL